MTTRRSRAQALSAAGAADERRHRLRRDRRGRGRPGDRAALALRGREVLVAEATEAIGTGTSSRNSEVIHAGIYYPAGSLKARLCVRGKHLLYAYCAERGVPHKRLGKLIVATDTAQAAQLEDIARRARQRRGRPAIHFRRRGHAAGTGAALHRRAAVAIHRHRRQPCPDAVLPGRRRERRRAVRVPHAAGIRARAARGRLRAAIRRRRRDAPELQHPDQRGRPAGALARRIDGVPAASIPASYLCKGSYFTLSGRAPFSRLIYPFRSTPAWACT